MLMLGLPWRMRVTSSASPFLEAKYRADGCVGRESRKVMYSCLVNGVGVITGKSEIKGEKL